MPEELYKQIFSKNLNLYMEINEKTQTDIVNELGFNKSAVSTWCNGTRLPRMDKVETLAQYFHINRSDLIEEKAELENDHYYLNDETRQIAQEVFDKPELRSLFKAARTLSPEHLKAHINFIENLKAQENNNNDGEC